MASKKIDGYAYRVHELESFAGRARRLSVACVSYVKHGRSNVKLSCMHEAFGHYRILAFNRIAISRADAVVLWRASLKLRRERAVRELQNIDELVGILDTDITDDKVRG